MPLVDTTTILKGFGQSIIDWTLGDDRQLSGDVQSSTNPPPVGDQNITDAYFTLKKAVIDSDANSIFQIHITQAASNAGTISAGLGGAKSSLLFKIFSANYQSFVNANQPYYWDIRCITAGNVTFTVASGQVTFLQNITQADSSGAPATLSNSGVPVFRGFTPAPPTVGIYNTGDYFMNSNPQPGAPSGWQCGIGGAPGTWYSMGVVGDTVGG